MGKSKNSSANGDDLLELVSDVADEKKILAVLSDRFSKDRIYSRIGPNLIVSLNPFKTLEICSDSNAKTIGNAVKDGKERPAHVFELAATAYFNMVKDEKSQSILFLGETGSGKSEGLHLAVKELTAVSKSKKRESKVPQRLSKALNILEAFGNAKTLQNNNSSRFGKYVEMQFNARGKLTGAKICDYLLERTRVSDVPYNERSFHIFYHLLSGCSHDEKQQWNLGDAKTFKFLAASKCYSVPDINDNQKFVEVKSALKACGFKEKYQVQIFQLLAAILHLGNLEFGIAESKDEAAIISNQDVLDEVSEMLGVRPRHLENALVYKTKLIKKELCTMFLDSQEASEQRDIFCQTLYSMVWVWIVDCLNKRLVDEDVATHIGLVDMFGIENHKSNQFHQLLFNFTSEKFHAFMNKSLFDNEINEYRSQKVSTEDAISYGDNSAIISLLHGTPNSILNVIDDKSGKTKKKSKISTVIETLNAENKDNEFYITFPKKSKSFLFGVRHHTEDIHYDAKDFMEVNSENVSPDFITLFRGGPDVRPSKNVFLANLFAQKTLDVEKATDHGAAVVNAFQINAPRVHPAGSSKNSDTDEDNGTFFSDYNKALEELLVSLRQTQINFVLCLNTNKSGAPNRLEQKLIADQIRTMGIADIMQVKELGYGVRYDFDEFVDHYRIITGNQVTGETSKDKISSIVREIDITKSDVVYGATKVFLTQEASRIVDMKLRAAEKAERKRLKEKLSRGEDLDSQVDSYYLDEQSDINDSDVESGNPSESDFTETDTNDDTRSNVSYGSEFSISPENQAEFQRKGQNFDLQVEEEEEPISPVRKNWLRVTGFLTWWIPGRCLEWNGMKRADIQQAWREKVALCFLIIFLSCLMLFFITGFSVLLCPTAGIYNTNELAQHSISTSLYVAVWGNIYDYTTAQNTHTGGAAFIQQFAGMDATNEFPLEPNLCGLPVDPTVDYLNNTDYAHDPSLTLPILNPKNKKLYKGKLSFMRSEVLKSHATPESWWVIVDKNIYDFTLYRQYNQDYLGDDVSGVILSFGGLDATSAFNALSSQERNAALSCMNKIHFRGIVDYRDSPQCYFADGILLAATGVLVAIMVVKFLSALQLGGAGDPEDYDRFVLIQVPCYTEGEENLKRTLESLATLKYDDKRKLLFIIADGNIIGSGNDRATWRIVLDLLGVDPSVDPPKLSFQSLGEGNRQHNMGKVYTGLYDVSGHLVPYVVVVKIGKDNETQRPGNRGKRDSQMILMRFLQKVHYDEAMSPLELELFHQIKNVIGVDPSFYEFALMVDADTEVFPDSLNRLVSSMVHDAKIVGICGETTIANERDSWITMMQVYEYYISHHLAKAFESLFGSVTCLPGCFCMYRIRTPSKSIPLLTSNAVIADYSVNNVDTLHKKNLLALGEDRYLTTLMLKHFPNMKLGFTSDAQCKTNVPDRWSVLLSQRRRWINSTVHNLAELILLPQLCGFCCFSMRFVVFFDLFATLVMPATMGYLGYLIYSATTGRIFPIISIILLVAGYGLQVVIFLLRRKWEHIGWLIIYILALPFFTFVLPLYAFWHFDDFSWGNTRIVVGEKGGKKQIVDEEPFDPASIPMKKWSDYEAEMWEKESAMSGSSRGYGTEVSGGMTMRPQSVSGSVYGQGSTYGLGSVYGMQPPAYQPSDVSYQLAGMRPASMMPPSRPMSMAFPGSMPMASPGSLPMSSPQPQQMPAVATPVNGEPTNEQITSQIKSILATANLMTVTKKQVRDDLSMFFGMDMAPKKEFINKVIEDVLQGRL